MTLGSYRKCPADKFRTRYPGPHRRDEFLFIADDGHIRRTIETCCFEELRPVVKRLGLYYKGFGRHAFRRVNITYRRHYGGEEWPSSPEKQGLQLCKPFVLIGGPGRVRTDDLFHAMEARSQLRHRPT